ncbi:MAG TPA: SAM-dependent methyltransferase, partial [Candidatus Polarisedimenticolia bacterium]|nr:SAM-dependent methyltransferase [Candidatus Polarisedimenticolia bacterium]
MDSGDPGLVAWLRDRIRARGPLPFVEFMEASLYHPEHGYYCRDGATTGPDGDFYTSPDVHPAFGRLIARQVAEIAEASQEAHDPFTIVEVGPGTGKLARDVIAGLAEERPDLARRVRYRLVEVSPSLRQAQQATLSAAGSAAKVADIAWARWQDLLEHRDAARGERFTGCVLANEFLDALPVHVVENVGGSLREVHVDAVEDRFDEVMLEPSTG